MLLLLLLHWVVHCLKLASVLSTCRSNRCQVIVSLFMNCTYQLHLYLQSAIVMVYSSDMPMGFSAYFIHIESQLIVLLIHCLQ